jgi:hypothetical protein
MILDHGISGCCWRKPSDTRRAASPNNLDLPLDGGTQHEIVGILLERPATREIDYGPSRREHILKVRNIDLVTRHKRLDVW